MGTMGTTVKCEMWLLVDTDGAYVACEDRDDCRCRYGENVQSLEESDGFRMVKVVVEVPVPQVQELHGAVPAAGNASLVSVR